MFDYTTVLDEKRIDSIDSSVILLEKEQKIIDNVLSEVGPNINLGIPCIFRDIVVRPSMIGSWIAESGDVSLFSTINVGKLQRIVMDKYGFGIMNVSKEPFSKKYVVASTEAFSGVMRYTSGKVFNNIFDGKEHILGQYAIRPFNDEKDEYLLPLLQSIYFKNIRDLKI
ncbi:MAG: hypothetical protein WC916_01500 [Candidatus Woesearchaeota archaeon]